MGITEFVKNSLFPKYCLGCGRIGVYICPTCRSNMAVVRRDSCAYCGRASFFGLTHPGCRRVLGIDGIKSFFHYTPLVQNIIKKIKYQLVFSAIDDLMHAIPAEKLDELSFYHNVSSSFTLIPVPLHTNRLKKRGFNQSNLIAVFIAANLQFEINDCLVYRKKNTASQTGLKTDKERFSNVLGAFSTNPNKKNSITGSNLIIVDDVWTTGSTIKEMCRLLKRSGAQTVYALTVAH